MTATAENQNKITCLYVRVSTQDQVSGMESQIRTLKEFCEKNGVKNAEIFADEGISGAKHSRPGLDRMMKLVREGKAERVIVYSFSRFARSVTHLLTALEEFRAKNVSFISYTEQVDTNSPMGRAFFTLTGESMPARCQLCKATQNVKEQLGYALSGPTPDCFQCNGTAIQTQLVTRAKKLSFGLYFPAGPTRI